MIDDAGYGIQSKNETLLAEKDMTNEIEFMDADSHQIQIEYTNEELRVYVIDGTT